MADPLVQPVKDVPRSGEADGDRQGSRPPDATGKIKGRIGADQNFLIWQQQTQAGDGFGRVEPEQLLNPTALERRQFEPAPRQRAAQAPRKAAAHGAAEVVEELASAN